MVELDEFLHRRPAELSGGQRQRVALARAIVRQPNVFLMDEPLSNLDAKLRVSTRAQIKNLSHEFKVTTIYVTHDQIEAMTLADRVVVMSEGVVQQVGSPTEIYDRPANTFVASFIGSPAMNLLEGTIESGTFTGKDVKITGLHGTPQARSRWAIAPKTHQSAAMPGRQCASLFPGAVGRCHDGYVPHRRCHRNREGRQRFSRQNWRNCRRDNSSCDLPSV